MTTKTVFPAAPVTWHNPVEHFRKIATVVNNILNGKINSLGDFSVTESAATTVVVDQRAGADSCILFMPTNAASATELASGSMYVSVRGSQTFTVTHTNSATTGRDFRYCVLG